MINSVLSALELSRRENLRSPCCPSLQAGWQTFVLQNTPETSTGCRSICAALPDTNRAAGKFCKHLSINAKLLTYTSNKPAVFQNVLRRFST
jgi:hypothetical protein